MSMVENLLELWPVCPIQARRVIRSKRSEDPLAQFTGRSPKTVTSALRASETGREKERTYLLGQAVPGRARSQKSEEVGKR